MTGHGPLGGAYTHGHIAPRHPNRVFAADDHVRAAALDRLMEALDVDPDVIAEIGPTHWNTFRPGEG